MNPNEAKELYIKGLEKKAYKLAKKLKKTIKSGAKEGKSKMCLLNGYERGYQGAVSDLAVKMLRDEGFNVEKEYDEVHVDVSKPLEKKDE